MLTKRATFNKSMLTPFKVRIKAFVKIIAWILYIKIFFSTTGHLTVKLNFMVMIRRDAFTKIVKFIPSGSAVQTLKYG